MKKVKFKKKNHMKNKERKQTEIFETKKKEEEEKKIESILKKKKLRSIKT